MSTIPFETMVLSKEHLVSFSITFLLCFNLVNSQILGPILSPILPPILSPLVPDLLNFLDQRLAIVFPIIQAFKNTITSDPLGITLTWVGPNICNYKGFYCDNPPDNLSATTVASIDFNGFQLSAPSLDDFIDQLPDLALFHANSNNFSGTFPSSILNMPTLSFLDIRYNLFTGTVPQQIFIKELSAIFLNNNNFLLTLPNNIGETTASYLTFANNKFTGSIPSTIGKASSTLLEVLLLNNQLTGCLPYEIGFLKNLQLFDAGNNLLTGPLPFSLGCLKKVEQLNFARNMLYGQVPEVVCSLGNLENLTLSYNYFNRVGPLCRKLIKSGVLDVKKNCIFDLPDQRPMEDCVKFYAVPRTCLGSGSFTVIPCQLPMKPRGGNKRRLLSYSALERKRVDL
ncbi:putative leucine-rich repeat domain, L domain-containing protein [Medicago truncatula]|uniref:Putative leucine-rich repeat domain, L domain-containing protein n=1 Tax=Medicago truncatula TaxID=3880 RepID=A0A396IBK3_MEDTR|nr:putative leucine-rich repeat domain, L domain-containing protein [Medicago truncatula]